MNYGRCKGDVFKDMNNLLFVLTDMFDFPGFYSQ